MASGENGFDHSCPACLLVVDGNPHRAASIARALRTQSSRAPKVTVVSGAADALRVISREPVRAVLVEHRRGGGLDEQMVRTVVKSARRSPVLWLIEDDEVVQIAEAVAAGVSGVYYWDQLGPELLSVIGRLAPATWSDPASLLDSPLSAGWAVSAEVPVCRQRFAQA